MSKSSKTSVLVSVQGWLEKQGYPLEFETAAIFKSAGFSVRQGQYVRTPDTDKPREIDVVAEVTERVSESEMIRVYQIVECKWCESKPWVIFTHTRKMSAAACVSQTIASDLGEAILWKEAGNSRLHDLGLFDTPKRSGFNGRQAFSDGKDHFYNAMHSVTTLSAEKAAEYDRNREPLRVPKYAVVVFPVIVINGKLFEAHYCERAKKVVLNERQSLRCHWKGAPAWDLHATVDVVTVDHLSTFAAKRKDEVRELIEVMVESRQEIVDHFCGGVDGKLSITKGSRGIIGSPELFRELAAMKSKIKKIQANS